MAMTDSRRHGYYTVDCYSCDSPGHAMPGRDRLAYEEGPMADRSEGDSPPDITPLSLLERARANDPEAWRRLVELYRPLVTFWCNRGGIPAGDAEVVAPVGFPA